MKFDFSEIITLQKRGAKKDFSRDHDVCCLYKSGETLEKIGDHYSVSRERIRQILKRYDITGKDGGQAITAAENKKIADAKIKAAHDKRGEKYGVTWGEYVAIKNKIGSDRVNAFCRLKTHVSTGTGNHKKNVFEITLAEYVGVWESAGLTVNQKGYMLTRIDYSKGFTLDNVHVITAKEFGNNLANTHGFIAHPENAGHGVVWETATFKL